MNPIQNLGTPLPAVCVITQNLEISFYQAFFVFFWRDFCFVLCSLIWAGGKKKKSQEICALDFVNEPTAHRTPQPDKAQMAFAAMLCYLSSNPAPTRAPW